MRVEICFSVYWLGYFFEYIREVIIICGLLVNEIWGGFIIEFIVIEIVLKFIKDWSGEVKG